MVTWQLIRGHKTNSRDEAVIFHTRHDSARSSKATASSPLAQGRLSLQAQGKSWLGSMMRDGREGRALHTCSYDPHFPSLLSSC